MAKKQEKRSEETAPSRTALTTIIGAVLSGILSRIDGRPLRLQIMAATTAVLMGACWAAWPKIGHRRAFAKYRPTWGGLAMSVIFILVVLVYLPALTGRWLLDPSTIDNGQDNKTVSSDGKLLSGEQLQMIDKIALDLAVKLGRTMVEKKNLDKKVNKELDRRGVPIKVEFTDAYVKRLNIRTHVGAVGFSGTNAHADHVYANVHSGNTGIVVSGQDNTVNNPVVNNIEQAPGSEFNQNLTTPDPAPSAPPQ